MTQPASEQQANAAPPRRNFGWVVAPLIVFLMLAAAFGYSLSTGDPSKLPSALIGKPVPQTQFAALEGLKTKGTQIPGFASTELADGQVRVINFWASWCVPCVQEHPLLIALQQRTGVPIFGVNYKDQPSAAKRFIGRYGNPYARVGIDPSGRNAIEWGVYGMPETFIVDGKGRIAYKHVGPISERSLLQDVIPAVEKARAASQ
ncbi:MAG: DsbE family thiol:disulfide interchange protein [Alphaproteobacteria bacterium]|nr:DsbE family thiol:disulfide interchange protein [Alphaproteobacteria bacterium]